MRRKLREAPIHINRSITPFLFPAVILLAVLLLSCSNTNDSVSSVATINQSDQTSIESGKELTNEEIATNFSQCMRDRGFDVKDPEVYSDGSVNLESIKQSIGDDPLYQSKNSKYLKTMDECLPLLREGSFSGEKSEYDEIEEQDKALKFTECLRELGINVPDPDFSSDNYWEPIKSALKQSGKQVEGKTNTCSSKVWGNETK